MRGEGRGARQLGELADFAPETVRCLNFAPKTGRNLALGTVRFGGSVTFLTAIFEAFY